MFSVGSVPDIANAAQAPGFDKMRSGRDCRTVFRPLVFHPRCFSMRDFGVGRTKWNAVPAGVRQLPERRFAWSGLQIQPQFVVLTMHHGLLNLKM